MTWGDLVTAHHSTGIGDITVYGPVPVRGPVTRAASAVVQRMLRYGPARDLAARVIRRWIAGPDDDDPGRPRTSRCGARCATPPGRRAARR